MRTSAGGFVCQSVRLVNGVDMRPRSLLSCRRFDVFVLQSWHLCPQHGHLCMLDLCAGLHDTKRWFVHLCGQPSGVIHQHVGGVWVGPVFRRHLFGDKCAHRMQHLSNWQLLHDGLVDAVVVSH